MCSVEGGVQWAFGVGSRNGPYGFCVSSCSLACWPANPRAWIDEPIDGASAPVGTPGKIISHAFARQGVKEVQLSIDGKPFKRSAIEPPGGSFGKASQDWLPDKVGVYVLQVSAYDAQGQASRPLSESAW